MSLHNKVIVFLGNTRFDSAIQATSLFLARSLARDNKVYFVDYPFTLKDYLKYRNSTELKTRKEKFKLSSDGMIETDLPNLKIVVTPPVVPINFLPEGVLFRSALQVNEGIMAMRLKKILKAEKVKDFIFINSFNFHYPNIAKALKPSLSIYQCVDPMIVPYDMRHGIISEAKLVRESDVVICTSKALYNEKKELNPNTYFVPNAADIEHCRQALDPSLKPHPKLQKFPKPIIGYIGSVERRFDYKLLTAVVQSNPDKSFVLAGPVWREYIPEKLFKTPNLHFIGTVPYNEVPAMVKGFDVAIIPFKKDEVSATIFPLKLFEYLCAGKPVVVSDFNPDLKDYTGDLVDYCGDPETFSAAINSALENNTPEKVEQRLNIATQNTWDNRAEQIGEIINAHLKH